jgi:hypothetical protein
MREAAPKINGAPADAPSILHYISAPNSKLHVSMHVSEELASFM